MSGLKDRYGRPLPCDKGPTVFNPDEATVTVNGEEIEDWNNLDLDIDPAEGTDESVMSVVNEWREHEFTVKYSSIEDEIKEFAENKIWLLENFGKVANHYRGQYVAIKDKEIIASDKNIPDLKDKVEEYTIIEYIPTEQEEDEPLIL